MADKLPREFLTPKFIPLKFGLTEKEIKEAKEIGMYTNQYIEISNRASGKTERLANAIIDYLMDNNKDCLLVTRNSRVRKVILENIAKKILGKVDKEDAISLMEKIHHASYENPNSLRGYNLERIQKFFDEFPKCIFGKLRRMDNVYAVSSLET